MPKISFDDSFLVGDDTIDGHHRKLVGIINRLHDAIMSESASKELTTDILKELLDYATVHFKYEDELMKKSEYPSYKPHHSEHQIFVKKVNLYLDSVLKGEIVLNSTLMSDLSLWLSGHILNTDKKFSEYLGSPEQSRVDFL